eukprot:Gregarina_sp_Pseudo_9__938@NODE_159_length_3916_cov_23_910498_g146_i0_p9_GENE_NODE_159_length_3916_cov_23_910498_g146_i0NODE_159_length_3916_cov_23_910498_g146_i0_p9_ORF_typecomplete_len152_score24_54ING/PF12998_7/0_44_NODE_159_length_3916_cov_23_910498_g146_i025122967
MRNLLLSSSRPSLPQPLQSHFLQSSNVDEEIYIAMTRLVQCQTLHMQEAVKSEIQKKAQEIHTLMEIYYTLQPNKALNLLVSNPEILRLLSPSLEAVPESKLVEIRNSIRAVQQSKSTGREKPRELVKIFNDLVNSQVIRWNGSLKNLEFT